MYLSYTTKIWVCKKKKKKNLGLRLKNDGEEIKKKN